MGDCAEPPISGQVDYEVQSASGQMSILGRVCEMQVAFRSSSDMVWIPDRLARLISGQLGVNGSAMGISDRECILDLVREGGAGESSTMAILGAAGGESAPGAAYHCLLQHEAVWTESHLDVLVSEVMPSG